jgi:hypothetical protein
MALQRSRILVSPLDIIALACIMWTTAAACYLIHKQAERDIIKSQIDAYSECKNNENNIFNLEGYRG